MKLAQEAVQLEPHNADARARLGWCHLRHGQWGRAEALLREALALGPHHADNVEQCGLGLALLGETGEARALIQRAFRLNPFPRTDYFADTALTLALEGKFTAAVEQFEIAADPSLTYLAVQTACLGHAGQRVAAEACAERLRAGLAAIWSGPDPAVDADVPGMMQRFLPLRDDQHRAMLAEGLRAAGLQLAATRAVSLA
jgi:tetratricopeptide (TPR) repeat protein